MSQAIRAERGGSQRPLSFGISGSIHGFLLGWLALSPVRNSLEPGQNLYDQQIRPYEKKIVWYAVKDRLPDVSPTPAPRDPRPPRALRKFDQSIVAGAREIPNSTQMIYLPEPKVEAPKPLPLPNIVTVAPPPRLVRTFTPPPVKRAEPRPQPAIPEAPRVQPVVETASLPLAPQRPQPRTFTPPPEVKQKPADPAALPEAPKVNAPKDQAALPPVIPSERAPLRTFTPAPVAPAPKAAPAAVPDAPAVTAPVQAQSLPIATPVPRAPLRTFTPPTSAAPPPRAAAGSAPALPAPAPAVPVAAPAQASLAIAGLNPTKVPDFTPPPGSRDAGFSAGPQPRADGGDGGDGGSMIVVPGLLARGGAKDDRPTLVARPPPASRQTLIAAASAALATAPPVPAAGIKPMTAAPDPRLQGRAVYSIAIQMPNVTSYSGSWTVWFAERQPLTGTPVVDMRAPVPLRKVDPKYIASAADERVEGSVRLIAVIRKDGHVDSVALLRHLDDRLDRSSMEALAKWEFSPALRNGVPVDLDAIFEIPFHVAPRPAR